MLDKVRVMGRMRAQGVVPLHFWINSRAGESLRGCFFVCFFAEKISHYLDNKHVMYYNARAASAA